MILAQTTIFDNPLPLYRTTICHYPYHMIPTLPINLIQLGPLTFHLYGLILGTSLITTYYLAQKWAPKHNITTKLIDQIYFLVIPPGLIGARAYHVLSNWDFYSKNPLQIPAFWNGGIGILGGIITGLLVLWFISKYHGIPFLKLTDFFAPLLALGQSIGRWGNYANQELYGQPTNLPWAVQIDPQYRLKGYEQFPTFHPLFLYESILNLINFYLLIKFPQTTIFRASNFELRTSPTSLYLINYGLIRFFLEFLKIDPDTTNAFMGLKTAQCISLIMILLGLSLIWTHSKKNLAGRL